MKIPEKAPDISSIALADYEQLTEIAKNEDFISLIKKANSRYLYWDKFKYCIPHDVVGPRLAWYYLKLARVVQARRIPLRDQADQYFNYWLPDKIQEDLHFVDKYAGGQISLDKPINQESQDRYLISSLMEEAISSSILEGAATTRKKAKQMLLSGKKPVSHADRMIYNNYRTIKRLRKLKDQPLTVEMLNELHHSITEDTFNDPGISGRFRNENDELVSVMDDQGTILYTPPHYNEIERQVNELIGFANEDHSSANFIHPVIKAIILHFSIGYIHPYNDGNGRTARAIFYWLMLKNGYWMTEYISISRILLKSAKQYARAYLYTEMDDQDLTYFISYHLKSLRLAFQELRVYVSRRQKTVSFFSEALQAHPDLNLRQVNILKHALSHSGFPYTIQQHKNFHGVTYQTARTDLLDLSKKNMMELIKRGKTFYFVLNKKIGDSMDKMTEKS